MACVILKFSQLNKISLIVLGLICLSGCGSQQIVGNQSGDVDLIGPSDVSISNIAPFSHLTLELDSGVIQIGQSTSLDFSGGFKKPTRATVLSELPPVLDDGFDSRGWETPDRHFSTVGKDGRLVLALDHFNSIDKVESTVIIQDYQLRLGAPDSIVETEHTKYIFWQDGTVRLMLLQDSGGGQTRFTQALGIVKLMDALRINPENAREDSEIAEKQYLESSATQSNPVTSIK